MKSHSVRFQFVLFLLVIILISSYSNCSKLDLNVFLNKSSQGNPPPPPITTENRNWLNWYGISWRGNASDNIRYAKQMGYDHISIAYWAIQQYKNDGLGHYLINPYYEFAAISDNLVHTVIDVLEKTCQLTRVSIQATIVCDQASIGYYNKIEIYDSQDPFYNGVHTASQINPTTFRINLTIPSNTTPLLNASLKLKIHFSQDEINFYNSNMVWIDKTKSFPYNLAASYYPDESSPKEGRFRPQWDFQQQRVINLVTDKIIKIFENVESTTGHFTGYLFDEASLKGEFQRIIIQNEAPRLSMATLFNLTGISNSSLIHDDILHDYLNYSDASAEFFKQLLKKAKEKFPNVKWGIEPYTIFNANSLTSDRTYTSDWVSQVFKRNDHFEFLPNMIIQEGSSTDFMKDERIYNNGYPITRQEVGTSQPNRVDESDNRLYAALAALHGGWYWWFGRFGGTINMPNFSSITSVYPRLKLVRLIPHWDNLSDIPLEQRKWDGVIYKSPNSYLSEHVIYSHHWKSKQLFVVFNDHDGNIQIPSNKSILSAKRTNGFFEAEGENVLLSDFIVNGSLIQLKPEIQIDLDSSNGQVKGNGYIFELSEIK